MSNEPICQNNVRACLFYVRVFLRVCKGMCTCVRACFDERAYVSAYECDGIPMYMG